MNKDFKLNVIYEKCRENKNSHVYLVETNDIQKCIDDIKELIKLINIEYCSNINELVDNDSLPSLKIIKPDKQEIKADSIKELLVFLQSIPNITKDNYFIISEAEKLNAKSGNSMLKIIEEPQVNMLGFFVCINSRNVLETIKSRTQHLFIKYNSEISYDENIYKIAEDYLKDVKSGKSILINKDIVDKFKDINIFSKLVDAMIDVQKKLLINISNNDIIKKENIITKYLIDIQSKVMINCNVQLLLDSFVIKVGRL